MNASIKLAGEDRALAANPFLNATVTIPSSCAKCLSSADNFAHHASAFLSWALLTDTICVFVFLFCLVFIFAPTLQEGGCHPWTPHQRNFQKLIHKASVLCPSLCATKGTTNGEMLRPRP